MKKLIIGNWKMNPVSEKKASVLLKAFDIKTKHQVVICPPFLYLKKGKNYILGAQNCFNEKQGAFTGEVSAQALKEIGCKYIILGHSERRNILNETNELINKKIKLCLELKLKPVLCIGEKEGEDRKKIINTQLKESLKGIEESVIIAYEPIWAIGTGKVPTIKDIQESFNYIKKILPKNKVLYGGSVNAKNIKDILEVVDGVLVGGASVDKKEFLKMIK